MRLSLRGFFKNIDTHRMPRCFYLCGSIDTDRAVSAQLRTFLLRSLFSSERFLNIKMWYLISRFCSQPSNHFSFDNGELIIFVALRALMSVELGTILSVKRAPKHIRKFSRGKTEHEFSVELVPDASSFKKMWAVFKLQTPNQVIDKVPMVTQRSLLFMDSALCFLSGDSHSILEFQSLSIFSFVELRERGELIRCLF